MRADYADITGKLGAPRWWDEVCAPRYLRFRPEDCNDIYAEEAMLIEIRCQACGRTFLVAETWNAFGDANGHPRLSALVEHGHADWGDPPRHDCVGDTMSSESIRVVEFWKRVLFDWMRMSELERPTPSWWAVEDTDEI